jgi:hypothetical protein
MSACFDALKILAIDVHHDTGRVLIAHENRVQHAVKNVGLVKRLTVFGIKDVAGLALSDVTS